MTRRYYTLIEKADNGFWSIEFGAYDKGDCDAELEDRFEHGVRRKNLKIIATGPKQPEIDAAVAKLNQEIGKTMTTETTSKAPDGRMYFLVTADHRFPECAARDALAQVSATSEGAYYATMRRYGCSKNYATAEDAIRAMLADHACRAVTMKLHPNQGAAYEAWFRR